MLPQLDVDFHLAPFVDSRDHVGAPHFEKPREFWVRPVRWTGVEGNRVNLIVRPVEAEDDQLFLAMGDVESLADSDEISLPETWEKGFIDGTRKGLDVPVHHLERYWRHPCLPTAAHYSLFINQNQFAPALHLLNGSDQHEFLWATEFGEPLTLSADEWIDWSAQDFHSSVSRQFDDPQSEIYLTWQWIQIPPAERFAAYVGRPEWSEFMKLMRLVLQSEFLHNNSLSQQELKMDWHFGLSRKLQTVKPARWASGCFPITSSVHVQSRFQYSPRLDAWSKAIRGYYESLPTQMPAPRFINRHIFNSHPVSCFAPSHHEMLEARLQLHAWAHAHLPSEEAQSLIEMDDLN